jgi:hypothetical protein
MFPSVVETLSEMCSCEKEICSIAVYRSCLTFTNSIVLQFLSNIHQFHSCLQFLSNIHQLHSCLQFLSNIHQLHSCLQFLSNIHQFHSFLNSCLKQTLLQLLKRISVRVLSSTSTSTSTRLLQVPRISSMWLCSSCVYFTVIRSQLGTAVHCCL